MIKEIFREIIRGPAYSACGSRRYSISKSDWMLDDQHWLSDYRLPGGPLAAKAQCLVARGEFAPNKALLISLVALLMELDARP